MKFNFLKSFKFNKVLVNIFVFAFLFIIPFVALAQANPPRSTPTPGTNLAYECQRPGPNGVPIYGDCDYQNLIEAVQRVVNWLIIFTLEFSVVVIAYAGFKYMISGDNPGERTAANLMLRKVAIGIFFVLAAWLIVNLIARALLTPAIINVTPPVTP